MTKEYDIERTSQGLDIHEADEAIKQLREALCTATCQMRDLVNGWPERELCEPPSTTFERLNRLVPGHEVQPLDPASRDVAR